VTSGALPTGLTLTPAGVLSGTPTTPGGSTFTVTATNGVNPDAITAPITVTVKATTTVALTSTPDAGVGVVGVVLFAAVTEVPPEQRTHQPTSPEYGGL
jgi:hypothetical protein